MTEQRQRGMVAVTGCDSGIGYSLVKNLLAGGWNVVAACYKEPPFEAHPDLICWCMDLKDETSIDRFAELVVRKSGHTLPLECLIHNAGMVLTAPVENMPLSAVREVFEVNFFGLYSLTKKLIPTLIHDQSRVIVNASLAGRVGLPFFSPYVASKYAVEGFAESLRQELQPFGVKTIVLDTGAVATPIWNKSWDRIQKDMLPHVGPRFRTVFIKAAGAFVTGGNRGLASDKAAKRILAIMDKKRPRAHYFLARLPWLDWIKVVLPTWLRDRIISASFELDQLSVHKSKKKERLRVEKTTRPAETPQSKEAIKNLAKTRHFPGTRHEGNHKNDTPGHRHG